MAPVAAALVATFSAIALPTGTAPGIRAATCPALLAATACAVVVAAWPTRAAPGSLDKAAPAKPTPLDTPAHGIAI